MRDGAAARDEVLVVGNYCHDTLIHAGGRTAQTLGGSSAYISSILGPLGLGFSVVAKVGDDFLYADRVSKAPLVVRGAKTTEFVSDFTHGERECRVPAVCEPIHAADVTSTAGIGMACGVMGELLPETLQKLRKNTSTVLCDIQALIRERGENGELLHVPLRKTPFIDLLSDITVLKVSRFEAQFIDLNEVRGRTTLIITEGAQGCTVHEKGREFHVEAFAAREIDPTGAGDCFLAGLAFGLSRGRRFGESVRLANFCGSQAVSQVGVPRIDLQALLRVTEA